jgi:ABC-2 type transport system permease protein
MLYFSSAGMDLNHCKRFRGSRVRSSPITSMRPLLSAILTALRRVSSSVSAAQTAVKQREAKQPFTSEAEKQAFFESSLEMAQSLQSDAPERVTVIEALTEAEVDYDPRANSSAGQLITWVFIPLFGISALFAYERQQGTLRRLLTTPASKATFLFGTIFGQVTMALVQMLLLIGFGILVMKLNWGLAIRFVRYFVASALAAAAFGTTMVRSSKPRRQASGLSVMFGMVFALMGGCWYPLELFPPAVQNAVKVLPTTWAMQGMLDLVLRGGGLREILPEAGVLLGFAVVFFSVGVWRFRYE